MAAKASIWPPSKAAVAGRLDRPSRACRSWIVMAAAFVATAISLRRTSALSSWLSSMRRPWLLRTRKSCSMVHRSLYQSTICQAAVSLVAWCVVQQPPVHGLDAVGWVELDGLHEGEL